MSFSALGAKIWPLPPSWGAGVAEELVWQTDVLRSEATAVSQHRALRAAPRRSFTFETVAEAKNRMVADMLLAGHSGVWYLPIWPDVQWLAGTVAASSDQVPCMTAGFDFRVVS